MNNAEVIKFPAPNVLLQSFTAKKKQVLENLACGKLGSSFHGVTTVILGGQPTDKLVDSYADIDAVFYRVSKLPVHELLEPDFLLAFIHKGAFLARTINTWQDVDSTIVLSNGTLHMSVAKDVYQELGLEGISEDAKHPIKYNIKIKLNDERFIPGSKFHKRVFWCLKKSSEGLQSDWIMQWKPHDEDVCPSSLAANIDRLGYKVAQCRNVLTESRVPDVPVPLLCTGEHLFEAVEWAGAAAFGIECHTEENYTSSLSCPQPHRRSQVSILNWKGFFTTSDVKEIVELIHSEVSKVDPWLNITLYAFDDSLRTDAGPQITSIFSTESEKWHALTCWQSLKKLK